MYIYIYDTGIESRLSYVKDVAERCPRARMAQALAAVSLPPLPRVLRRCLQCAAVSIERDFAKQRKDERQPERLQEENRSG